MSKKTYNFKNEVTQNQLGFFPSSNSYLQDIEYTYNAQGWLTSINELFNGILPNSPNPCGSGDSIVTSRVAITPIKDLFAQNLSYDHQPVYAGISPSHNGNVSTQYWWHRGQYNQSYSYKYDFLDRVKKSLHGQSSVVSSKLLNAYNEDFDYDLRGNITKLNRKGMMYMDYINPECMQVMTIDSLDYNYDPGSNKLMQVSDKVSCQDILQLPAFIERDITYAANQKIMVNNTTVDCTADILLKVGYNLEILDSLIIPASCQGIYTVTVQQAPCDDVKFSEGFSQQSMESYGYDTSGNTIYDPNKKLTFQYNFLNLPYRIIGVDNDTLFMFYDATGTLLQRKYKKGNNLQYKRDYLTSKEWKNDTLDAIYHNDGRIVNNGTSFYYEYFLKDHLGSVRTSFVDINENGVIEEIEVQSHNDYYAFGMPLSTRSTSGQNIIFSKNRHLFNNKEFVNDMNLGLLQFETRNYDPVIGRFLEVDKISGDFPHVTTYNYAENEPIRHIDLWGTQKFDIIGEDEVGYIRPATEYLRKKDPLTASIADVTFLVLEFLGINNIDNILADDQATTTEKVITTFASLPVMGKGGGKSAKSNGTSKKSKTFQTYTKEPIDPSVDGVYSGKTSGFGTAIENISIRDKNHHKKSTHKKAKLDKTSSNSDAIRGREQINIDSNGGAKSEGGKSGNSNRGVSKKNKNAKKYEEASKKEFGS